MQLPVLLLSSFLHFPWSPSFHTFHNLLSNSYSQPISSSKTFLPFARLQVPFWQVFLCSFTIFLTSWVNSFSVRSSFIHPLTQFVGIGCYWRIAFSNSHNITKDSFQSLSFFTISWKYFLVTPSHLQQLASTHMKLIQSYLLARLFHSLDTNCCS